jgi:hypothetical protein
MPRRGAPGGGGAAFVRAAGRRGVEAAAQKRRDGGPTQPRGVIAASRAAGEISRRVHVKR